MLPGSVSKLSETTVASAATLASQKTDMLLVTGTTGIATIPAPRNGGFNSVLFIVPTDGSVGLLTTGNIATAVTMAQNRVTVLVYSASQSKWYPGAIS